MKIRIIVMTSLLMLSSIHTVLATEETSENSVLTKESVQETVIPTEDQYLRNIAGIQEISSEKLVELLESGSEFNLFLGRKTCPHCRAFSSMLHESIPLLTRDIYYVNVENEMNDKAMTFFKDNKIGAVPTILFIAKGKIISGWIGEGLNKDQVVQILNAPVPEENIGKEVTSEENKDKQQNVSKEEVTLEKVSVVESNSIDNKQNELKQEVLEKEIVSEKQSLNTKKINTVYKNVGDIKQDEKIVSNKHLNKTKSQSIKKVLPKTGAIK